jgi:cytochrome P450
MSQDAAPSLFDTATLIAPYAAYRWLRDHDPVHFEPALGVYVVSRYDLVREAIRDTKTFSSRFDGFLGKSQEIMFNAAPPDVQAQLRAIYAAMTPIPPTMLTLDEPEHSRYRSLVSALFTAAQMKRSEPEVARVIDTTIADFGNRTELDFMAAFGFPVPLTIIATRLGIPDEDRPFFDDAATAAAGALRLSPIAPDEMVRRAQLALDLQRLLIRLIEARREAPREDMISILANSKLADLDRHLTHGECLSILNQFLVAGHETTTSTFGWGMLALCQDPSLQDRLRADPSRVRTFVEEVLRVESPVQGLPRLVTQDTELGGCALPAGSMIMLRYGAANRDERQFADPDRVDLDREKAGMQLAFGSGVHHCIGAPLARQELNLGFPALLARMRNIRLAPGHPAPEAEPSFVLRNLPSLHIAFDPIPAAT